ncbi:uncharacterized protein LOC123874624 [Maniola jurtina]|uniref:uncharacterized protein LOC123874624 n=1 Tax=Maniola jurtina TaxID=191418 RepID=UPI001E68CDA0|nr:uncharacterized protein LOC123874624 [Maniola jurtina]XP_045776077.1 uncharacterized protein LOC123874624 [Maniola jurtina]
MEDIIDNDMLISMVEERTLLWDKNSLMYKDRYATRKAWAEVCRKIYKGYEGMSEREKREFGKAVTRRWTNLRDAYTKYKRKLKRTKEQGLKIKKYVYNNQMKFLAKFYDSEQSADEFDANISVDVNDSNDELLMLADNEKLDVSEERHSDRQNDMPERNTQRFSKRKRQHQNSKGKKKRVPDEIELKLLKVLEEKPDPHISFFQGVLPHLHKYDDNEVLEFQTGVLRLISTIDAKKKASSKNSQQPSSSNYFNSPSTSALQSRVKLPRPSPEPSDSSEKSIDFDVL